MARKGRKPKLDDGKQREVIAMLSVGCPRTVAARYVGCSPATIANTAARDAAFAKRLRQAGYGAEVSLLRQIRKAADKEQYWRAAAWALERVFPERYARRGPDVLTVEQLAQAMAHFAEILGEVVSKHEERAEIIQRVDAFTRRLRAEVRQAKQRKPAP